MSHFLNINGQWISQEALIAKRKLEQEAGVENTLEESAEEIEEIGQENLIEQPPILTRDEIKAILVEQGIEFKGNASTESLKQLIQN